MLSRAKHLVSRAFRLVPESVAKDRLRCLAYNALQSNFRISREASCFVIEKDGLEMRFEENPFGLFQTDADYLRETRLQPGDVVVDAGAYIGVFTVYAALSVGATGHVYAFEPDPGTARRLQRHLDLNHISNVTLVTKGLWSSETVLEFESGRELGSSFMEARGGSEARVRVPVTTLDAVLDPEKVRGPVFVKMNIEGSEIEALKGAARTITRLKPRWVIRTNHIVNGETTAGPVEQFLGRYGYGSTTLPLYELTTFANPPAPR